MKEKIGVLNYFADIPHCNLQKELLLSIYKFYKSKIMPATENIYNDINHHEDVDINAIIICGMGISEYRSFMQYLETCIHFQTLVQIWEQQVVSTIFHSLGRTRRIIITKKNKKAKIDMIDYEDFKDVLRHLDVNIENWDTWEKISEIRKIVNVIKHSMGRALNFVKENNPDAVSFDENTKFDSVTFSHSSLLDFNINIHEKLDEYVGYLVNFWDEVVCRVIER